MEFDSLKRYKKNWIFIGVFFFLLFVAYFFYHIEIYSYMCEREDNAPACYVLSLEYEKKLEATKAKRFLEVSCEKKYELACEKLNVK